MLIFFIAAFAGPAPIVTLAPVTPAEQLASSRVIVEVEVLPAGDTPTAGVRRVKVRKVIFGPKVAVDSELEVRDHGLGILAALELLGPASKRSAVFRAMKGGAPLAEGGPWCAMLQPLPEGTAYELAAVGSTLKGACPTLVVDDEAEESPPLNRRLPETCSTMPVHKGLAQVLADGEEPPEGHVVTEVAVSMQDGEVRGFTGTSAEAQLSVESDQGCVAGGGFPGGRVVRVAHPPFTAMFSRGFGCRPRSCQAYTGKGRP